VATTAQRRMPRARGRPVSQIEAVKIAEKRFLKIPGALRWVGRYKIHVWSAGTKRHGDVWIVDFNESGDGTQLANMAVDSRGRVHAIGVVPDKFK
jgi:hypothetical protein